MKITIDNLDGTGTVDYSGALCTEGPVKIARALNSPSMCSGMLDVSDGGLAVPVRRGRVVVAAGSGTVLFTGYIATDPEAVYAGTGLQGPVYRYAFSAVSDEWLLDKQPVPLSGAGLAQSGGELLATLTNRVDDGLFTLTEVVNGLAVGVFQPEQTESWSKNAGVVAGTTYAAYRVLDGAVSMQPVGTVTHTLSDGDGTLQVAALKTTSVKELANDVTIIGEMEPAAYVSEMFQGDATTTVFQLSQDPFRPAKTDNSTQFLTDSFNEGTLDTQIWQISDPGSHLGLSAAGLTMTGGDGLDGQTTVTAIDAVELGGSLVIEAGSLQLGGASAGVVCGLYSGATQSANCFVGYNVRQSGRATVVVPFVNGVEVGTVFTLLEGHIYTLRIRLHCVEIQRVLQSYYAMVDGVVQLFGGGSVAAPMSVVFELQGLGAAFEYAGDGAVRRECYQLARQLQLCGGEQRAADWVDGILQDHADRFGVGGEHTTERSRDDPAHWRCGRGRRLQDIYSGQGDFFCRARSRGWRDCNCDVSCAAEGRGADGERGEHGG